MSSESEPGAAVAPPLSIAGLILAAGESSRMGADKPLLMYRGKTFLENILTALRDAGVRRVVVVLGHHAELIQQSAGLASVEVVVNQDYRRGQTSSLQAGLRLLAGNEPDGVVLCLADHPAITADTVRRLIQCFESAGKAAVIPQFQGRHGHPVLLGRELFSPLRALGPGQGADTVIRRFRDRTGFMEVADPGILVDVDDPEAYLRLAAQR